MPLAGVNDATAGLAFLVVGQVTLQPLRSSGPRRNLADRRKPVRLSRRRQMAAVWLLLRLLAFRVVRVVSDRWRQ